MQVNQEKSGVIKGCGADKLLVIIDGADREEVESSAAKSLARDTAVQMGYGGGGMCDQPSIGPLGVDGNIVEGLAALDPKTEMQGFRVEFMFAQRI